MVYIWIKNILVLYGKYWKENLYICVIKDIGFVYCIKLVILYYWYIFDISLFIYFLCI